jgi:hypothetical protein
MRVEGDIIVGDFYMMVGGHDVYGACLQLFVLVDCNDWYGRVASQYLPQVAWAGGVEVLGDHNGSRERRWEGGNQSGERLYPASR